MVPVRLRTWHGACELCCDLINKAQQPNLGGTVDILVGRGGFPQTNECPLGNIHRQIPVSGFQFGHTRALSE